MTAGSVRKLPVRGGERGRGTLCRTLFSILLGQPCQPCPQQKRGTFAYILRAMTVRPNPTFSVLAGRKQAQMNISDGRRSVSRHNLEVDLRAFANCAPALSPSLSISFFFACSRCSKNTKGYNNRVTVHWRLRLCVLAVAAVAERCLQAPRPTSQRREL